MRRGTGWLVVALVVGLGSPSRGQMGGMGGGGSYRMFGSAGVDDPKTARDWPVTVRTADGSATQGKLRLTTAVIDCSLGIYEIRPDRVQEIRFKPATNEHPVMNDQNGMQRPGTIVTTTGQEVEGIVLIPTWWRVETDLGRLTPRSDGIKAITFGKPTEPTTPPIPSPPKP